MIQQLIDDLREFAEYAATHAQESYLSLYLMTDPSEAGNQSQTPAWRTFLRNAVANVEAGLDPVQTKQWKNVRLSDESPEKGWARTRKRLDKYLTSYRPEGKTLVLFISPGSEFSFELPVRIDSASYYGKPHIQEFLWALDEYEQHSVLLFSADEVRVLRLALGRSAADRTVVSDQAWLRGLRKTGEGEQNQQRQDDITRRFVKRAANEVDKFFMKTPDVGRVVLGGNMELANAVLGSLHPSVKEMVIGVLPIPADLPPHEVAERVAETAEQGEREHEAALVADVIRSAGARGRGATGYTAVGHALDRGAVRLLALPYPAESDVIEPILLQAVRAGTTVEFLHGEAAERVNEAGGIVAQLYYSIN
ncbi:MAG: hypothetical protein IPH95_20620 [Candidatus Promineofilum sp.]|nr:hypothetical protein [Promineifilum sp.]